MSQLLRSQKNRVLDLIQLHSSLNPFEFEWGYDPFPESEYGTPDAALIHRPTGFHFSFRGGHGGHVVEYSPAEDGLLYRYGTGTWGQVIETHFPIWLECLEREYTAPDLWRELARRREFLGAEPGVENTPFSLEEQAEITRQLAEMKEFVRQTYELTGAQYVAIDERLDYLADAATRLGRNDWKQLFIGALVGAVLEAAIPPEPVQAIMNLVMRGLAALFGIDLPELPPAR